MRIWVIMAGFFLATSQQPVTPHQQDDRPLIRSVDENGASVCRAGLFGFRNVPMRCTVGSDGTLAGCEILTDNRAVHRASRRFHCMASKTSVHYPDGTPAVGRMVRVRFSGDSLLSDPD